MRPWRNEIDPYDVIKKKKKVELHQVKVIKKEFLFKTSGATAFKLPQKTRIVC